MQPNCWINTKTPINDDIEGTGIITLAGILGGLAITGEKLRDQKYLCFGAGTAGCGIVRRIYLEMQEQGLTAEEARQRFYLVDKQGLLFDDMEDLTPEQKPFARKREEFAPGARLDTLEKAAAAIHPTILVGTSTCAGAFTESIVREMASHCSRPMIFPLSNPTELAEAKAAVDEIRARVNMPNLLMATANANPDPYLKEWYPHVESDDNQGIILEIRRERAIELVMEGFRYYDIMRWKEGKIFEKPFLGIYFPGPGEYDLDGDGTNDVYLYLSTDKGNSSCVDQFEIGGELSLDHETSGNLIIHQSIKRVWNEDKDYLYPIPTKDRVLTNGALTQNPGWNDGLIF